jgi:DNA-binding PadR family transcriptional regulator
VARVRFGRLGEPAMWVLVALRPGPKTALRLLDDVRSMDGQIGPGSLFGTVARLERLRLIEPVVNGEGRPAYRLSNPWISDKIAGMEGLPR